MAFAYGYSLAMSRSNDASMITRSSVSSLRAKFDTPSAPKLLKLGVPTKLSISRRGNLTTCSANAKEESAQSAEPDQSVAQLVDVVSKSLQPYLQLARVEKRWPFSAMLFFWPFYWGVALAAENGSLLDWKIFTLLTIAIVIFRSAASTVNDLCDMDFDGKVERTKLRPLVTGVVTPFQAWAFLGALTLLYMAILSQLKTFSLGNQFQVLVAIQLFFNGIYPLSKRWTHWVNNVLNVYYHNMQTPAVLGLAINWGVFLGWTAVKGPMDFGPPTFLPTLVFFAACCWTLVYETIYAHQDIKDDRDVGIKSMAILLGNDTKLWLPGFGVAFVAIFGIVGHITTLGWPFYVGVAASAIHMVWQIASVDINNPVDCKSKFDSNIWVGALIFGGIVCGKLLA